MVDLYLSLQMLKRVSHYLLNTVLLSVDSLEAEVTKRFESNLQRNCLRL